MYFCAVADLSAVVLPPAERTAVGYDGAAAVCARADSLDGAVSGQAVGADYYGSRQSDGLDACAIAALSAVISAPAKDFFAAA